MGRIASNMRSAGLTLGFGSLAASSALAAANDDPAACLCSQWRDGLETGGQLEQNLPHVVDSARELKPEAR